MVRDFLHFMSLVNIDTEDDRLSMCRSTVMVGLFIQQAIAMFVLKSGAGFSIFKWIALLASDFLEQSKAGASFFFSDAIVAESYFFVNTVRFDVHLA